MPSATPPTPLAHRGATLVEITIRDIGMPTMRAEALVGRTMAELNAKRAERALHGGSDWKASFDLSVPKGQEDPNFGDATIQVAPLSTGAFTATTSGQRYFNATFRVRNAQKTDSVAFDTPRENLTFIPVSTASPATLPESPVLVWNNSNGSQAAAALVRELKPTGLAATNKAGQIIAIDPDVLQAFEEDEVANVVDRPEGVTNIFPYGFTVKVAANPAQPRLLPANPPEDVFAGVVTIAFRLPVLGAAEDPTTITLMMLAVDDSQTRITQSLEEQDPASAAAVQTRANAIEATVVRTLPGNPGTFAPQTTQLICSVRTAGTEEDPTAFLVRGAVFGSLNPSPSAMDGSGSRIDTTQTLVATFNSPVENAGPSTFVVRGLISGQAFRGQTYTGNGTNAITTPAGAFLPAEDVEVTLTSALACPQPWVGRLKVGVRIQSSGLNAPSFVQAIQNPQAVAIGAFRNQNPALARNLDLAIVNGSNQVTIQFGNGAGGFTSAGTFATGQSPVAIVAGDFNGDGFLDLATANFTSQDVTVLLGNGDGTFREPATSFPVGGSPTRMTVGDVNGDGVLDLVTANQAANSVAILLGNRDGTFRLPARTVSTPAPSAVAIGDMNNDGIPDLVVGNRLDGFITVLIGHPDGTFTPAGSVQVTTIQNNLGGLALGDIDGDGKLDVATAFGQNTNGVASGASVVKGGGDGLLQTVTSWPGTINQLPTDIAIADMNGDGHLDLVITSRALVGAGTVIVILGNGSVSPGTRTDSPVAVTAIAPRIADLNRDGRPDVVVGGATGSQIAFLLARP